jgi:hypothetical protein
MPITGTWYKLQAPSGAPQVEGAYELGNSSGAVVYIGRSNNLGDRLSQHAATDDPCIRQNADRHRYEATSRSVERKKELFVEYKRTHAGLIPSCNVQDPSAVTRSRFG